MIDGIAFTSFSELYVSKYFRLEEFLHSETARQRYIRNMPGPDDVARMVELARCVLDPIRRHIGGPLGISSGYRSQKLNRIIGGATSSQHTNGEAADIDAEVYEVGTNSEIFKFVYEQLDFDQLIWEFGDESNPEWVHVSFRNPYCSAETNNRNEVLRAFHDKDGEAQYVGFNSSKFL